MTHLQTLHGTPLSLDDLRGDPALLLFWNIGCAGCVGRALPFAVELAKQFPSLQIVAIHSVFPPRPTQPQREVQRVADHYALPFVVALDDGDTHYRAFGAEGTPHWVILNEEGAIYRSFFGSMAGQQQRLLYALQALFDSQPVARPLVHPSDDTVAPL
ncbi:MAG: TlpA family protein disulfide reductase [Anaerolineales bacterium]|nr:TlpA family protein disulfide reductase [Anaerolineales bacterium]MCB9128183.1 TlpA family protein disulfide reductase [Ardenticatenales bacterium]MCB9171892.1 TlpA family protein disulfide reductase [Ardenticatenales bacterium]